MEVASEVDAAERVALFEHQKELAERRLEAAKRIDAALIEVGRAYGELKQTSHALFTSLPVGFRDTNNGQSSVAGGSRLIDAIRIRLKHLGVEWAHPESVLVRPDVPVAAVTAQFNDQILALQKRRVDEVAP